MTDKIGSGYIEISLDGSKTFKEIGVAHDLSYITGNSSIKITATPWEPFLDIGFNNNTFTLRIKHRELKDSNNYTTTIFNFKYCRLSVYKEVEEQSMSIKKTIFYCSENGVLVKDLLHIEKFLEKIF